MKRQSTFQAGVSRPAFLTAAMCWTLLVVISLSWNWRQVERSTTALAAEEARSSFNKDVVYRLWNAKCGGVYVPATERTPPNPYLAHMPERDVTSATGVKLTLINPAYMTRLVHQLDEERFGTRGHITSLNPIRSENASDGWEAESLRAFETGLEEVVSKEMIDGRSYLRLMRPLITTESCLKCHAAQGYQEGDVRGGISVSVPLAPYDAAAASGHRPLLLGHLLVWLLGLAAMASGNMLLRRAALARRADFERMVGQISSNFVRLAPGKADEGIERALAAIGEFTGADRVYVFQLRDNGTRMDNTHEWCAKGVEPQIDALHDVSANDVAWWIGKLRRFEMIHISSVEDLPSEAQTEKVILDRQGVQSLITAPLAVGDRLTGFLGADAVRKGHAWTNEDLILLQLVGETIVHALDRDRAEKALADQTERLNRILHGTNVGTWEWNVQTGEMVFNDRWMEIIGYTPEEVSSSPIDMWTRFCHPDDLKVANNLLQECFDHKAEYYSCETRIRHKNGEWIWVQDRGKVITWTEDGRPAWMYGTRTDINQQKHQEQERREMYERLQQTQRLESLGIMAGGIAHDFNNIIMAIMGNAELALDGMPSSAPGRQNLAGIVNASKRAADLCSQMLAYSGKGYFEKKNISLRHLIEETLSMLKTSISKKCMLNLNLTKGLPHVHVDPIQIRQILMNLVINASEAIGDLGGVITISIGAADCFEDTLAEGYVVPPMHSNSHVYVDISDTGRGIDRQIIQRIFEPFFTTKFIGRGLGLSAVLGIIRSHEGALWIHSEPDRGSTFKILFPAVKSPMDHVPVAAEESDWHGKGTILLVDDDEVIRTVTSQMLLRLGLNVVTAIDGRQAVVLYRREQADIDLVLLDLTMPRMNGEEAFQELRKINPGVRVILASGYSEEDVFPRFTGKGLAGCLQKPYTLAKLRSLLSCHLSGVMKKEER